MGMQSERSICCLREYYLVMAARRNSFPKASPRADLQYVLLKACVLPELVTKMDFSPDGISFLDTIFLLKRQYTQLTSFTMIYLIQQHQTVFFLSWFNRSLQQKTLDYSSTRLGNRTTENAINATQSSSKSKRLNAQVYFYLKSSRYILFFNAGNLVFKEKVCGQEKH